MAVYWSGGQEAVPQPLPGDEAPPAPGGPTSSARPASAAGGGRGERRRPVERGGARRPPRSPRVRAEEFWHADLEALRELEALVSGEAPFDLSDSDEFIVGRVSGLDPAIVRRLRKGEYAVQGHVDLHGMTRDEAKLAVDRFLRESRNQGKRCVLLVHGRGTHSRDQVPVLKEALKVWLATQRFGRHVLAFATARPVDGGAGAIYVLLRRAGR